MCSNAKNTLSELVLAAVFYMQQKNGVSVMQIAEYVAEKRCCNPCKIRGSIKSVLTKAKEHGIMCESKGLYRIEPKYEDKLDKNELKPKKEDECDNGNGAANDDCVALDANGSGNGGGAPPCCPQGADHDAHAQDEGGEEDEDDDDDDDDDGTCPDDLNDMEEPLPKKRRMYDRTQEYREGSDDDEEEKWAKCVEKKLWNLTKSI